MYDAITPEQWVIGLLASLLVCGVLVWLLWHYFPARDMSSEERSEAPRAPVVPPVVTTFTTAEQPIAMPNNEYTSVLSNNERIAFETTAKNIAVMYEKGIVTNLSKAICAAYGCSVQSSSKPESTFQMALKAVNKHLPQGAQFRQPDGTTAPASHPVTGG